MASNKIFVRKKMALNFSLSSEDLKLRLPFGGLISGPSSSGKTEICRRIVEAGGELFTPPPASILYAYGQYNKLVPHFERIGVSTVHGVPSDDLLCKMAKPSLLILDDLLFDVDERWLANLYTKRSHHENFGVLMLVQNLFDKKVKVPRLNSMYIILMRSPSSLLSIRNLGTQLYPKRSGFFLDAYHKATAQAFGYLLIDMHPSSPSAALRLRTSIFPGEVTSIFMPKSGGGIEGHCLTY
jgi:hypothetical protein